MNSSLKENLYLNFWDEELSLLFSDNQTSVFILAVITTIFWLLYPLTFF